MDRNIELRIKGHLYEIKQLNQVVIGSGQGLHSSEDGYRKTLESVAACDGVEIIDEVAEYIKDHIQEMEDRPKNRKVRKHARILLSRAGIAPDDYLNRA